MRPVDPKTKVIREFVLQRNGVPSRQIAEDKQIGRQATDRALWRLVSRGEVAVVRRESVAWSTRPVAFFGAPSPSPGSDLESVTRAWCSSVSV